MKIFSLDMIYRADDGEYETTKLEFEEGQEPHGGEIDGWRYRTLRDGKTCERVSQKKYMRRRTKKDELKLEGKEREREREFRYYG
jgi:hypothetical protein